MTPDALGPGKKFDTGKPRFDLLPARAVVAVLDHTGLGQGKRPDMLSAWREVSLDWTRCSVLRLAWATLHALELELGGVPEAEGTTQHYPRALLAVARVLALGAAKYGPNNWQRVTPFRSRYLAAWGRHWLQWLDGLDVDEESGEHHLAHAACCALFLVSGDWGHTPPIVEAEAEAAA